MSKKTSYLLFSVILILLLSFIFNKNSPPASQITVVSPTPTIFLAPTEIASSSAVLGARIKSSNCLIQNSLPDRECTPGEIIPTATKDDICTPGYSKSVRSVPQSEKDQVYLEYGIASHSTGEYEVDHLVSLELGGSNDISNLWPEPANPRPGFHEKDKVENYLHQKVCNGEISLQEAQQEISVNWLSVYSQVK